MFGNFFSMYVLASFIKLPFIKKIFSGFLVRRWDIVAEGQRATATTFLLANSLLVQRKVVNSDFCRDEITKIFRNYWQNYKENPLEGRDNILASICPQVGTHSN